MLSAILHSDVAIQVSIRIMQTFVEMRKYLAANVLLLQRVNSLEAKQLEADIALKIIEKQTSEKFDKVFDCIASREEVNQKIFFDGQIFDAFSIITELIQKADKKIILIDGYVDIVTLNILVENKAIAYEKTNEFMERFKSENGSYICKEILGCDISTDEGRAYAQENNSFKEICPGMVKSAVNILESII